MIKISIEKKLTNKTSLYKKLKRKLLPDRSFAIPKNKEFYTPDTNDNDKWTMLCQDESSIRRLSVSIYTSFNELIEELVVRDIRLEDIIVLNEEQIEIDIKLTE